MRITNAFKILINNSSVIYKSMFFKLIVASILCLIGYFIIANDVGYLVNSPQVHDFWNAILTTFNEFIKGNGVNTQLLPQAFDAIKIMIRENAKELLTALLKVGGFVFLLNLVERMCNYAVGVLTNDYMSALSKFSLVTRLFANFAKALLYSLIIVPLAMIFDAIVFALAILIVVEGIKVISIFAIIISIMFVVLALSCKFALFSTFMPKIVDGKTTIGKAFIECFSLREKFFHMVGSYAFAIMISFYLNVSVAVFTLGVGLIISIPLTSVFIVLINFVDYYQLEGKRYYVSGEQVVTPRQMRKNAELVKYM